MTSGLTSVSGLESVFLVSGLTSVMARTAESAGAAPPAKLSSSRVLALTFVAGCIGARRNLRLTLVRLTVTVAIVLFSLVDYALSVGLGLARAVRHHYRTFGASLAPGGALLLSTAPPPKTKVVVIGGSFAGLRVQRELSEDFDVTVVDVKVRDLARSPTSQASAAYLPL